MAQNTTKSSVCLHSITKFQNNDDKVCRFSGRNSKRGIREYYKRRQEKDFFLFRNVHDSFGAPSPPPPPSHEFNAHQVFFPPFEESDRGVKLTTHFHLVPRIRMSGFCLLHPLYAFMSCIGSFSL